MNIRDRKGLKQTASTRLCESSYDPRLLALLYISVSVGVSLVLAIVTYILQEQIGGTGGLAGIGTRSVLVTVQAVLQLASTLLIPFWDMGLIYTSVQLARGKAAYPVAAHLGFRTVRIYYPHAYVACIRRAHYDEAVSACAQPSVAYLPGQFGYIQPFYLRLLNDYEVIAEPVHLCNEQCIIPHF